MEQEKEFKLIVYPESGERRCRDIVKERIMKAVVFKNTGFEISYGEISVRLPLAAGVYDWEGWIRKWNRAVCGGYDFALAWLPTWMSESKRKIVEPDTMEHASIDLFVSWLGKRGWFFTVDSVRSLLMQIAKQPDHPGRELLSLPEGVSLNEQTLPYLSENVLVEQLEEGIKYIKVGGKLYGYIGDAACEN